MTASLLPPDDAVVLFILGAWGLLAFLWLLRGLWKRPLVPRGTCIHGVTLDEECAVCTAVLAGKHIQLDDEGRPLHRGVIPPSLRETADDLVTPQAAVPVAQDPVSGAIETPELPPTESSDIWPDPEPPRGAA